MNRRTNVRSAPNGEMTRSYPYLFLGIVALLALGCGRSAEDRLAGTWVNAQEEDTSKQGASSQKPGLAGLVSSLVEGAASSVRVEIDFRADGTGSRKDSAFGFAQTDDGFWKVVAEKDDTAMVYVSPVKAFEPYEVWRITFVDSERLRVSLPELGAVELVRQK